MNTPRLHSEGFGGAIRTLGHLLVIVVFRGGFLLFTALFWATKSPKGRERWVSKARNLGADVGDDLKHVVGVTFRGLGRLLRAGARRDARKATDS